MDGETIKNLCLGTATFLCARRSRALRVACGQRFLASLHGLRGLVRVGLGWVLGTWDCARGDSVTAAGALPAPTHYETVIKSKRPLRAVVLGCGAGLGVRAAKTTLRRQLKAWGFVFFLISLIVLDKRKKQESRR